MMPVAKIKNIEAFKEDLERGLSHYSNCDLSIKRTGIMAQLSALQNLAKASIKGSEESMMRLLEPVDGLIAALHNLNNGRRSEMLAPSLRNGKRGALIEDVPHQARAAVYMDRRMQVPGIDKKTAMGQAARKFRVDAKSVAYWREQAMAGDQTEPRTALFHHIMNIVTAKNPNSPEKQAQTVLHAHRRSVGR